MTVASTNNSGINGVKSKTLSNIFGSNLVWAIGSGGTETTIVDSLDGMSYKVHSFTTSGSFTVSKSGWSDILVVGGGGGGATADKGNGGSQGGGGQVIEQKIYLDSGTYTITVGSGGYPTAPMVSGGPFSGSAGGSSSIVKTTNTTSRTLSRETSPKYIIAVGGGGGTGYPTPNANTGTGGTGGDGYPVTLYQYYGSGPGGGGTAGVSAIGVTSYLRTGSAVIYGASGTQIEGSGNGGNGGGYGSISTGSSSGIVVIRYQI